MKTAEEIVEHLESELDKAQLIYDLTKNEDKQQALFQLVKVATITEILEDIKL